MTTPGDGTWPLGRLRVVDLSTGIAGGYMTKLLADGGADVRKLEPPGGDPLRRWSASDPTGSSGGQLFSFLHTSKRSTIADLRASEGRSLVLDLAACADLVVESEGAGIVEALGLGHEDLAARNPGVSLVSISPFGRGGPWSDRPADEFTLLALAGSTATRGEPGREHVNAGGRIGEWLTGVSAAVAGLAAWRRALATGAGDHVDVSMFEVVTPTCTNTLALWGSMTGTMDATAMIEVPSIEPTLDGYVGFCIFTGQQWQDFCAMVGRPEWAEDPELATMGGRVARGDEIAAPIRAWTAERTTAEVCEIAELLRIPVAPIGNGSTIPGMDQFTARGVFVPNPGGGFLQPRVPYRIDGHPTRPFQPAPELGADAATAASLAAAATPAARTPTAQPTDDWPLADVRVLDCTAFWAGPYAGFVLAGLGADVLHVESVQRPDGMRFGSARPPGTDLWWEHGPTFHAANAGKRSVTLDLGRDEGRALLRRLVERSDVLLENFSPRVMANFGLTWEVLHSWNPRLVMVRMPAFGLDGPWRDRVGFAQTMEQLSGMAWLTGYADRDPRNARGPCDPLAGLHAAFAALVGLEIVKRTGEGVHVEATMVETALNAAAEQVIEWSANGVLLSRDGNHHPGLAPAGVYPTADRPEGTEGEVALSVSTDEQWRALVDVVGHEPWRADTGLRTHAGRAARRAELDAVLAAWAAARPVHESVQALLDAGVPAAPVVGARWGDRSPQHDARGFYEEVTHAVAGTHRIAAMPWRFGRQPARRFARPAPTLGEHTREVLQALAWLDHAGLDDLEAATVIGTRPLGT